MAPQCKTGRVRVLIAPDCFTGTLTAEQAARAIADIVPNQATACGLDALPAAPPNAVAAAEAAIDADTIAKLLFKIKSKVNLTFFQ